MTQYVVGIDPGKTGGVALVPFVTDSRGQVVVDDAAAYLVATLPLRDNAIGKGKTVCCNRLRDYLVAAAGLANIRLVVIEKVGNRPSYGGGAADMEGGKKGRRQGGTSMFTFGLGVGRLMALFELHDLTVEYPHPMTWQKVVFGKARADSGSAKDRSVAYVQGRYPAASLFPTRRTKNPHNGIADALCLASYGLCFLNECNTRLVRVP